MAKVSNTTSYLDGYGVSRIDQCKFEFCFSRRLIGDGSCAMGAVCSGNVWGDDCIVGGSILLSWLVHDSFLLVICLGVFWLWKP